MKHLILIFSLASCAAVPMDVTPSLYKNAPIQIKLVDTNETDLTRETIRAVDYWNTLCGKKVFKVVTGDTTPIVLVIWSLTLVSTGQIEHASPDTTVVRVSTRVRMDYVRIQTTLRHELGHLLGGGGHHKYDPLMRPSTSSEDLFSAELHPSRVKDYCNGNGRGLLHEELYP